MDAQPLPAVSRLPRGGRRPRRIQRQVHGQPDGAARLLAGDARGPRARKLPQLLLPGRTLAVQRPAPCRIRMRKTMVAVARKRTAQQSAENAAFERDVIAGLHASPKHLPPKYFYDDVGSKLFDRITELPEYYPTRSELEILNARATEIVRLLPGNSALIEFGSGSFRKARILLDAAPAIIAYVPVDISSHM